MSLKFPDGVLHFLRLNNIILTISRKFLDNPQFIS